MEIADQETYDNLQHEEPYMYLQRILPQYVFAAMLQKLHKQGKRFIRIIGPETILNGSYQKNPALFAAIVRRQPSCPFTYVTCRIQKDGLFRITASETAPQKNSSFLGSCVGTMLGQMQAEETKRGKGTGFSVRFPFEGMPMAYANDPHVFRYRVQQSLRKQLPKDAEGKECDVTLVLRHIEDGYLLSRVPQAK